MEKTHAKVYDVVIVGAGPIGIACGIEAHRNNLDYVILEKGCIVNSLFNYPTNMTFFSTSEKIELGEVPFVSHGTKPTRREALEYYRRVAESYHLNINLYEKVELVEKENGLFRVVSQKITYRTKTLIIATGYYDNPNPLGIPGETLEKVRHYFDEAHPYAGLKTVVVGAGNSAVDVALELFRVGAEVTMIVREPGIKPSVKYWVRPDIENRIQEGSITAYFDSELVEVQPHHVTFRTPEGLKEISNDVVFAMTGYHPDFTFLKSCGVQVAENGKCVFRDTNMETNIKGLYVAGVVCSGDDTDKYFIENSIDHSRKIIEDIAKNSGK